MSVGGQVVYANYSVLSRLHLLEINEIVWNDRKA